MKKLIATFLVGLLSANLCLGGQVYTEGLNLKSGSYGTKVVGSASSSANKTLTLPAALPSNKQMLMLDNTGAVTPKPLQQTNYITANDFEENSAQGYVLYKDAAGEIPVDGTGGTATLTYGVTDGLPLRGLYSLLVSKPASNVQGEGLSYAFTIDAADKGKTLSLSFDYYSASYIADTISVWIYDVTNAALIPCNTTKLEGLSGLAKNFQTYFQAASNSTSYRLIWHINSTDATSYDIRIDNVSVSPAIPRTTGMPAFDPRDVVLTGSLTTNVSYSGKLARGGKYAYIDGMISFSGANTQGLVSVNMPEGLLIDTDSFAGNFSAMSLDSEVSVSDATGTNNITGRVAFASQTVFRLCFDSTEIATGYANYINTSTNLPITFASGDKIKFFVKVPIVGWSSNQVGAGEGILVDEIGRIETYSGALPYGLVPADGRSIGSAGSSATFKGDIYFRLYKYAWANADTSGRMYTLSSAAGASAEADWAANKTITIDVRNRVARAVGTDNATLGGLLEDQLQSHEHSAGTYSTSVPLTPRPKQEKADMYNITGASPPGFWAFTWQAPSAYIEMAGNSGAPSSGRVGTETRVKSYAVNVGVRYAQSIYPLAPVAQAPTMTKLTSGSGTYTPPYGVKYLKVTAIGGGGGGAGGSGNGTVTGGYPGVAGGTTTFSTNSGVEILSAYGGLGGLKYNGSKNNAFGLINAAYAFGNGKIGENANAADYAIAFGKGSKGGDSPLGAGGTSIIIDSGTNGSGYGAGGGGGSVYSGVGTSGSGGAAGGSIVAQINNVASSYLYSIGAGGGGGAPDAYGTPGGSGTGGIIVIEEFYQ